jgi:hypothetical protein
MIVQLSKACKDIRIVPETLNPHVHFFLMLRIRHHLLMDADVAQHARVPACICMQPKHRDELVLTDACLSHEAKN